MWRCRRSPPPDGAGAQWRRDAWASAGLLRDELSSTVLALNLRGTPALTGRPAEAPWDPELSAALTELGIRVEEETVLDQLLSDLV
ncbi:DUF2399 domain-containing protein [Streptomyces virginiae]|uniref:DUF2399 domain-containing protein n=1 Tax=Streptomyces virginiae TaxID=1961 RepID=UPI0033BF0564